MWTLIFRYLNKNIKKKHLTKEHKPYGLEQNKKIAKAGGQVAKTARDDLEQKLGRSIISNENNLNYKYLEQHKIETKKIELKNRTK